MAPTLWVIALGVGGLVVVEIITGFFREAGTRMFQLFLNQIKQLCDRYFDKEDQESSDSYENQNEPTMVFDVGDNSPVNVVMANQNSTMPINQDFDVRENNES